MPSPTSEASYARLLRTNSSSHKLSSSDPLHIFCVKVAKIHLDPTLTLSPENLAVLTKKLIQAERKLGGPYKDANVDEYITNFSINMLASAISLKIDSVLPFSFENRPEHLMHDTQMNLINDFFQSMLKYRKNNNERPRSVSEPAIYKTMLEQDSLGLNGVAAPIFRSLVQKVAKYDTNHEIASITSYFAEMLGPKYSKKLVEYQDEFSKANILAWAAYAAYDNIHDEQSSTDIVGIANILMRSSYSAYLQIAQKLGIDAAFVNESFNMVDEANLTLELELECDDLYQKSYGHTLGPRMILDHFEVKGSADISRALNAFLNAKQICDDIKDWEEDITNGSLSYVTRQLANNPKTAKRESVSVLLWGDVLPRSNRAAEEQINISKNLFKKALGSSFERSKFSKKVIDPIEQTIKNVNEEIREKNEFLQHFAS